MKVNYHIHTTFSDGTATPQEYIEKAIEKRFNEIAFTDHLTIFPRNKNQEVSLSTSKHILNLTKFEEYVSLIKQLQVKYSSKISIKLGLEVDYFPESEKLIEEILGSYSYDFDLLIGSVHFVKGICIDCSSQKFKVEEEVKKNGFDKFYSTYMSLVRKAVETGMFNIVGHMDIVRIWGYAPTNGAVEETKVLTSVKKQSMAVEVSSRGLRQPVRSLYPSSRIMQECKRLEVPVTIGTDAHSLEEIDYGYDAIVNYIKDFGYTKIATFNKGRLHFQLL
ncbi:MAG: histidinol-phosphatase HisJ [Thermoproteota archaeon]